MNAIRQIAEMKLKTKLCLKIMDVASIARYCQLATCKLPVVWLYGHHNRLKFQVYTTQIYFKLTSRPSAPVLLSNLIYIRMIDEYIKYIVCHTCSVQSL